MNSSYILKVEQFGPADGLTMKDKGKGREQGDSQAADFSDPVRSVTIFRDRDSGEEWLGEDTKNILF